MIQPLHYRIACFAMAIAVMAAPSFFSPALAAGGAVKSRTGAAPDRYVYYPGTEELKEDELRLFACGTGMPAARRDQAATCWLVELGNGDKILFDIGTGSMPNIAALMIPYDYLDKVILSHLHTDHFGDLAGLWAGGWTAGRTGPLRIWGPSGAVPEMGTAYAIEHFLKAYTWDATTRNFRINPGPGKITVQEFDYLGENAVIYQENGATVRSWPAIHAGDGPVSFSLEWKGIKIVIGGDTFPNKWYIKYAKDADIAIHESFLTPEQLVEFYGQSPATALGVGTQIHTSPQAFGKVMSTVKPRLAIGYHFFNEEATRFGIYEGVRETYDGPLTLAVDNMVWNVTKDKIVQRMTISPDQAWAVPGSKRPPSPEKGIPDPMTDVVKAGAWDVEDAQGAMIEAFKEKSGLK